MKKRTEKRERSDVWLQRSLIIVFVGTYIYFAVLPLIMKTALPTLQNVVAMIVRARRKKSLGR